MSEHGEIVLADGTSDPALERRVRDTRRRGGIGRFAFRRCLTGVGTLVFVLLFNFVLFQLLPGDPAARYRGVRDVSAEALAQLREDLNAPVWEQFVTYVKDPFSVHAISTQYGEPVWDVIRDNFWATVVLLGTATLVATVVGVWIGIKAGWSRGSKFDKGSTGVTLLLYATPEFWLGLILVMLFSSGVGPFPALFPSGTIKESGIDALSVEGVINIAYHTVLPATALALVYLADYSLIMRASMVDELGQDYLTTARAKGLMDFRIRRRHAVPNASLPTITLIFLNFGFIIGGAITVETVFSYPGLGLLSVEAINSQDLPLLQALFLLASAAVIAFNIVADIVIAMVDPRIRV